MWHDQNLLKLKNNQIVHKYGILEDLSEKSLEELNHLKENIKDMVSLQLQEESLRRINTEIEKRS